MIEHEHAYFSLELHRASTVKNADSQNEKGKEEKKRNGEVHGKTWRRAKGRMYRAAGRARERTGPWQGGGSRHGMKE